MTTVIGLDNVERPWLEVFPPARPSCLHGRPTCTGFIVRRIPANPAAPHRDELRTGYHVNEYATALARAQRIRYEDGGDVAVVDYEYRCGCRSAGR